jgi:hypothetical protein
VQGEERNGVHIAGFTPIEPRVRDDDLNTADEQRKEGDDRHPVSHADKRGVTGSFRVRERGSS